MWRKLNTRSAGAVFALLVICGCGNHDALTNAVDKDLTAQKVVLDGSIRVDADGPTVGSRKAPGDCYLDTNGKWVCGPICPYDCNTWKRACRRAAYFHRGADIAMCDSCDEQTCQ
jgi:hypothetical protein